LKRNGPLQSGVWKTRVKDIVRLISDEFILFVPSPWTRTVGSRRFSQPNFYLIIPHLLQNEIYLLTIELGAREVSRDVCLQCQRAR
jgi:hypothetical protein